MSSVLFPVIEDKESFYQVLNSLLQADEKKLEKHQLEAMTELVNAEESRKKKISDAGVFVNCLFVACAAISQPDHEYDNDDDFYFYAASGQDRLDARLWYSEIALWFGAVPQIPKFQYSIISWVPEYEVVIKNGSGSCKGIYFY